MKKHMYYGCIKDGLQMIFLQMHWLHWASYWAFVLIPPILLTLIVTWEPDCKFFCLPIQKQGCVAYWATLWLACMHFALSALAILVWHRCWELHRSSKSPIRLSNLLLSWMLCERTLWLPWYVLRTFSANYMYILCWEVHSFNVLLYWRKINLIDVG